MTVADGAQIDADDLAMLADGFEAAMLATPGPGAADAALHDLGWGELLTTAPSLGAATAFAALGRTGSAAGIIDDVLAVAFGLEPSPSTCVVLPRPHGADPPARREGDVIVGVNRNAVRTAAQVEDLLNVRSGQVIRVYLERDGQITFTDLVFR